MRGGDRTSLGLWGEKQAARYLRKQGFRVLENRFRCREGEIDLVVSRGPYLCFVEVKLRRNAEMAEAREFVTPGKQRRVRTAALYYLMEHPSPLQPRFDVAEVMAPKGTATADPAIYYLENAFDVGGWSDGYSTF